ncbi:hypothetical protein AERO9AM_70654 [Aeromicrobium sp. 9AM]|nr:hypothetical protein AERO9AM_70654 [Aeromicrobium sp. 9AM]
MLHLHFSLWLRSSRESYPERDEAFATLAQSDCLGAFWVCSTVVQQVATPNFVAGGRL